MLAKIADFFLSEDGTTAIEYAIIASVMALALAASAPALGAKVRGFYTAIAVSLP
jgi:Flp pilus assembly pilin Flp